MSVLCPGAVNTAIHESGNARPQRFGGPALRADEQFLKDLTAQGMPTDKVADLVMRAIRNNRFYIFTHAATRVSIESRHARILAALDEIEPDSPQ